MRMALGLEYAGEAFNGWQSQVCGTTVQDCVETALSRFTGRAVRVYCAGRTDAGVHATAQVVHLDTEIQRPLSGWVRGVNSLLMQQRAEGVSVLWASEVGGQFHARFSARARRYRYVLYNAPVRPALLARRVGWAHRPLDVALMHKAARCLVGEHDFSAFRATACQARSPVRQMYAVRVMREGGFVLFDFYANAFLYHMVRNLVGALVAVGSGAQSPTWLSAVLAGGDRREAAPTFAAEGLYLCGIEYPGYPMLPQQGKITRLPVLGIMEGEGVAYADKDLRSDPG